MIANFSGLILRVLAERVNARNEFGPKRKQEQRKKKENENMGPLNIFSSFSLLFIYLYLLG